MSEEIPQVIAIVSISPDGKLKLKKVVKEHLGMKEAKPLFLDMQDEIVLSTVRGKGEEIAVTRGDSIRLPNEALEKLGIDERSLVAFVQRSNGVAVKKFETVEKESEWAKIVDLETTVRISRTAETNPMPEELLPKLREHYKEFKLKYDVKSFLKGRRTLEAWKARKILDLSEPSDEELRKQLIKERLDKQREDGSWEGQVTVTARYLRELADLGMTRHDREIQQASNWLMQRPQSPYNPGMFFLKDELVEEQAEVIRSRQKQKTGTRERFRKLMTREKNLVKAGNDLIVNPCGPRIMWPNSLVLEALLKLSYEEDERVQRALQTLMTNPGWCECGFQHGLSDWRRKEPYSMKEIEQMEKDFIGQFRYGGISSPKDLEKMDLAHRGGMPRVSHRLEEGVDKYPLRMPTHFQGCEVTTTRGLSPVKNMKMRRILKAYLWRFAGRQHPPEGRFGVEKYGTGYSQTGLLSLFASYDHPISKVVIMRSFPWIVNSQNKEGSWGDESNKDASTLAVITALRSIGFF